MWKNIHMKDIIKRSIIWLITLWLIVYFGFLLISGSIIVQTEYLSNNTIYTIGLLLISIYILIIYSIYPIHIKFSKPFLFFIGIALIIISKAVLINNIEKWVYIGDIVSVLWVILTLLSWTNLLISQKILKKKADSKVEVIEV